MARIALGRRFAALNGELPQVLFQAKEPFAGLFAQHLTQQHAEGPHIAAQRRFLQIAGTRLQVPPGATASFLASIARDSSSFQYAACGGVRHSDRSSVPRLGLRGFEIFPKTQGC